MPSSQSRQSQQRRKQQQRQRTESRSRARSQQRASCRQHAPNSENAASRNFTGNAAVDAELVRLTSGAVISLLGLAEETGGVPNGLWRDPYALGFVYGTVCGLSVRVLASEDAELAPVLEPEDEDMAATAESAAGNDAGNDTGNDGDIIDTETVEAAVARHDLAGVMSESFHDILQFSYSELSAAPSLEDDMLEDDRDNDADEDIAAEENGAVVLARAADFMLAEQPDFLEGLRAADKVVALALGFPDYDADIDVIDARRRADAARIELAEIGVKASAIDGIPADIGTDDLRAGRMEMRGGDMIIDIAKLIAEPELDDDPAPDAGDDAGDDAKHGADFDEGYGGGDLYLLSQDEAAVLYLQQRLFCRELRRRLSP